MPVLFSVWNPDVLDLSGVFKVPAAFGDAGIEPVDDAAFVREHLLQIPDGKSFRGSGTGFIRKTPDRVPGESRGGRKQPCIAAAPMIAQV